MMYLGVRYALRVWSNLFDRSLESGDIRDKGETYKLKVSVPEPFTGRSHGKVHYRVRIGSVI